MNNSKNVARIFKGKGKIPHLKGKSGLREEENRKKMSSQEMRRVGGR